MKEIVWWKQIIDLGQLSDTRKDNKKQREIQH